MGKARLEAFSDGVIAILITIMILELKIPAGSDWPALRTMVPATLTYVLSFVFLGIYWTNHHHLLHATHRVTGGVLWANLHLLFWLSLTPLATAWMGEHHDAALPNAVYGTVLLASAIAYTILQATILRTEHTDSLLAQAVGRDWKGKASMLGYIAAIPLAFVNQWISDAIYIAVVLTWLIPDRRIESRIERQASTGR
jgi:TMEM175 potassium channel family protein